MLSFVAEVLALLTGRIPYISGVAVLASASYLVEAAEKWHAERRPVAPPDLTTAFVLPAGTTISLSAGGTRRLPALQQPSRSGDAPEERPHIRDRAVEVVDLGAELADDRDELLQRA